MGYPVRPALSGDSPSSLRQLRRERKLGGTAHGGIAWWQRTGLRRTGRRQPKGQLRPSRTRGRGRAPPAAALRVAEPRRRRSPSRGESRGVTERAASPSVGRNTARTKPVVEQAEPVCAFCPKVNRTGGTLPSPLIGPFTFRHGQSLFVHHICSMWAPEVYHDPETDTLRNVVAAYHCSRGLTCSVCITNGATVGYYVAECRQACPYCCLYGHPPPSKLHPEDNGPCVRHEEHYAAFCLAHAARANDEAYVRRMTDDAALPTLLSERAAAMHAALEDEPTQGMDCPNCAVNGVRRNKTETIFRRLWGVSSFEVDTT